MTNNILNEVVDEAMKLKLPYIVMMFHSSELMPGCSIYRPDNQSVEVLYSLLGNFFRDMQARRVTSVTLTEAAINYKK